MLDFTAALYLGFRHGVSSLRPWSQLTMGVPAALAEPVAAQRLARRIAQLVGSERATLGPSTFHLFWDLFTMLASQPITIFLDDGAYPIAGWGVERVAARGVPVHRFPHHDADTLARLAGRATDRRPVIVSDGVCTGCGCIAPVAAYREIARRRGGLLVLDDTQALGLLGSAPDHAPPYGRGGGGSLRSLGVSGPDIIQVSSLAKSFGAPLAVLAGSEKMVRRFRRESETRVHCSPPSLPVLRAGERALALNEVEGDTRRQRLAQRVQQFRRLLAADGLSADGGMFPVQTLRLPAGVDAPQLHQALLTRGLRTVLRRGCDGRPAVSLVINACHRPQDVAQVVESLIAVCRTLRTARKGIPT